MLAGVAVSLSSAEGTFAQPGVDSGTVESTMTTVSPYARFMVNDRVSAWGLAGWGTGDMTIVQAANDPHLRSAVLRPGTMNPARDKCAGSGLDAEAGALAASTPIGFDRLAAQCRDAGYVSPP